MTLTNASGALTFFPYPLKQVRGKLLIRDGYVDIEKLSMNRGDGSLVVDGRVSWKDEAARNAPVAAAVNAAPAKPRTPTVVRPDLTVTARNVPIDAELLASLPDDRRQWLQRIGLGGKLDLDGRVVPSADGGEPAGPRRVDRPVLVAELLGPAVGAVGDRFVVHMDREALNDFPLGEYDVTVSITKFERDREIEWTILGALRPQIGHVYGYTLEPADDGAERRSG